MSTNTEPLGTDEHVVSASLSGTVLFETGGAPLLASAIPVDPPASWFSKPDVDRITPLTISDTGKVFGHIAAWSTSHIGLAGSVKPPKSKSDYAFFKTGVIKTDDGSFADVGQITLSGGHASLNADARGAVAHYDDTNSAVMDVTVGEDRYGIWAAGALRPSVTGEQLRAIRASSVSGDWRPINGNLELVAICAVNCPGFPVTRARVASGATLALVAAGVDPIIEQSILTRANSIIEDGIEAGLCMFRDRVANLEAIVAAGDSLKRTELHDRVNTEGRKKALQASVRSRVHGSENEKPVVASADLRSRVHGFALRSRVHGPLVANGKNLSR